MVEFVIMKVLVVALLDIKESFANQVNSSLVYIQLKYKNIINFKFAKKDTMVKIVHKDASTVIKK